MSTASKSVSETSSGIIKAKEKPIAQGPGNTDITPGPKIRKFMAQNIGIAPIKINFDDDTAGNQWTLFPGERLPCVLDIVSGTVIHCRGQGGDSILQFFLWG